MNRYSILTFKALYKQHFETYKLETEGTVTFFSFEKLRTKKARKGENMSVKIRPRAIQERNSFPDANK